MKYVTVQGVRRSIAQWSRETGIPYSTLYKRFHSGWRKSRAVNPEPRRLPVPTDPMELKVYRTWLKIRSRCSSPKDPDYAQYGRLGIKVCSAWQDSFPTFRKDVGLPPSKSYCLNRIDNTKNYEPKNVKWVTRSESCRSPTRTRGKRYKVHGKRLTVRQWAEELGLRPITLYKRLEAGWPLEDVFKVWPTEAERTTVETGDE